MLKQGYKKRKGSNDKYAVYAEIYDAYKGDRTENIKLLLNLIDQYNPGSKTVLELACGTGALAQGLVERFDIHGIDNSPKMLQIAEKKLPGSHFILANMTKFYISQKFDVIFCLHNSVNHLLAFSDWEAMFENVSKHLNRNGIFILDINPIEKLNALAAGYAGIAPVGDNFVTTRVRKVEESLYYWDVDVFFKRRGNLFYLRKSTIEISAYPRDKIEEGLKKNLIVLDSFTLKDAKKIDDVGRTYFVCGKKEL